MKTHPPNELTRDQYGVLEGMRKRRSPTSGEVFSDMDLTWYMEAGYVRQTQPPNGPRPGWYVVLPKALRALTSFRATAYEPGDWVVVGAYMHMLDRTFGPMVAQLVQRNDANTGWTLDRAWPELPSANMCRDMHVQRLATPDEIAAACMACPTGPQDAP